MRQRLPFRPFLRILPSLLLALAVSGPASSQPAAPGPAELTPEARARLAQAAEDSRIAPWQRDLMLRVARTGKSATLDSSAADLRAARPAHASGAEDGAWEVLNGPSRYGHTAVYDPLRDRMLVFGGNSGSVLNDVWTLSLAGAPTWMRLTSSGTPPSPRYFHSAIYDPVRDRMVVFGGNSGSRRNDVWALALAGTPTWTQLTPSGTPPSGRESHSAIYDPVRDCMVVFGGFYSDGTNHYLNDVWTLSLSGASVWTQLTPSGTPPSGRSTHSAIYDPVRDRMLVFGGGCYTGSWQYFNDVWAFSLAGTPAWTQLTPSGTPPGARNDLNAIYDPVRDRLVVFGNALDTLLNDVWALSLTDTPAWTQLTPSGTPPGARNDHSAIYDPVRDRMVVFGGQWGSCRSDVWALSLAEAPAWTQLTPSGTPPGGRYAHSVIHDPVRDRMVVFGGFSGARLNDVWALSLAGTPAWTQLTPSGTPPGGRSAHGAIYDPVRDRMVVFGGMDSDYRRLNDVWALSLAGTPAWTQLTPSGTPPGGRDGHSAIYDPVRDCVVVFGGYDGSSRFNDVWALSLAGAPAWSQLTPSGTPPSARDGHSAIYDPVRDRMVLFGGYSGSDLRDVWSLSLAGTPAWVQLAPSGASPSWRYSHSAIYDPVRDRMVVFGGGYLQLNDVWTLSLAGTPAWTQLDPAGDPPSGRSGQGAIYDPVRDGMVVFGGNPASYLNDVWELAWGTPALASATCPGDIVWTSGAGSSLDYGITNPYAFARTADYTLTSGRDWPGFPISGSVTVDAVGTVAVPISVPVPDSAANGLNPLIFSVTLRGVPQYASCSHNLRDVSTPVLLSLMSAQADPGCVRLTWYATTGNGLEATVYRRTADETWSAVGKVSAGGTGRMTYEDRAVSPGGRYGYRLGLAEAGGETFAGETWVNVPLEAGFALAGVRPHPAVKELVVAFSLPDGSPARLEVFDLAGRRVALREVGSLGGGSHLARLGDGRALDSGIYLLRLTRGDRRLTTRAVVIR